MDGKRIAKGLVAGALAGLAATDVMLRMRSGTRWVEKSLARAHATEAHESITTEAPAAETASRAVEAATQATEVQLDQRTRHKTELIAHYAIGAGLGAAYGALAEAFPKLKAGHGLAFALAVWIAADELGLPALRIIRRPSERQVPTGLFSLASHLAYGWQLESARRELAA